MDLVLQLFLVKKKIKQIKKKYYEYIYQHSFLYYRPPCLCTNANVVPSFLCCIIKAHDRDKQKKAVLHRLAEGNLVQKKMEEKLKVLLIG